MRFLVQLLLSLQHVHSKQILHRDLKTQNILLNRKQEVIKITDFGISKVLLSKSKAVTVSYFCVHLKKVIDLFPIEFMLHLFHGKP